MTKTEIAGYIDRGAEFYVDLFGRAEHMERVQREHYSLVRPNGNVFGISFVYNVRLDGLPPEVIREQAAEIRSLGMPVWLGLGASEEVRRAVFGERAPEPDEDGEVYLFMLPENKPEYQKSTLDVRLVYTPDQFAPWANIVNRVLSGGKEYLHLEKHYCLCQDGALRCYMGCQDGRVVSAAAVAWDGEAASLEFVATYKEYRCHGFASALCQRAITDIFREGPKIVTVRAIDGRAARLYDSLGFERY